jgi:hypothetical protein
MLGLLIAAAALAAPLPLTSAAGHHDWPASVQRVIRAQGAAGDLTLEKLSALDLSKRHNLARFDLLVNALNVTPQAFALLDKPAQVAAIASAALRARSVCARDVELLSHMKLARLAVSEIQSGQERAETLLLIQTPYLTPENLSRLKSLMDGMASELLVRKARVIKDFTAKTSRQLTGQPAPFHLADVLSPELAEELQHRAANDPHSFPYLAGDAFGQLRSNVDLLAQSLHQGILGPQARAQLGRYDMQARGLYGWLEEIARAHGITNLDNAALRSHWVLAKIEGIKERDTQRLARSMNKAAWAAEKLNDTSGKGIFRFIAIVDFYHARFREARYTEDPEHMDQVQRRAREGYLHLPSLPKLEGAWMDWRTAALRGAMGGLQSWLAAAALLTIPLMTQPSLLTDLIVIGPILFSLYHVQRYWRGMKRFRRLQREIQALVSE